MSGEAARQILAGYRVLVVEDEFFIADDLAEALRALGAVVVGPAPNRDAAFAALTSETIHLAVLDINLKGQPIFPVADALSGRGIPFLFATGYTAASVPERYRTAPHWEKPFDPAALAAALPAVLGKGTPLAP